MKARQILDREFLQMRAQILDIAAALDRLDRASGDPANQDPRYQQLLTGIQLTLDDHDASRAQQLQLLFSRDYDPNWRSDMGFESK